MAEKLKVIGFGVGSACEGFLHYYGDEYEILALSDWDKSLYGTIKYGHLIINPEDFSHYNYDKIIILSSFANEIKSQLKERLQIDENELIFPPKYKLKGMELPFQDKATHNLAKKLLIYLFELSNKFDVELFLDFGTLLGITRENDFIYNDDDVDLAINERDRTKLLQMLKYFLKNPVTDSDGICWMASLKTDVNNNIWAAYIKQYNPENIIYKKFITSIGIRKFYRGHSFCMHFKYLSLST